MHLEGKSVKLVNNRSIDSATINYEANLQYTVHGAKKCENFHMSHGHLSSL